MKAVVLRAPGDVGVDEVAEPEILDPGDAIVAVSATAICGADLFPYHGLTPGFEDGTILGHEFAGEIVAVGRGIQNLRVGQRVVNASMISCGTCPSCGAGRVTQCDGRALFGYSGVYPRPTGLCARCRTRSRTRLPSFSPTSSRRASAQSPARAFRPETPSPLSAAAPSG
jgi:threonine dehydrogenase-like Zn-dependent dehydrogenase